MEHALDLAAWVRWHAAARDRVRTHVSLQKLCFYGYGAAAALDVEEAFGAIRFEAWQPGMWWIGRLSTDADRERVLDGMALDRKLERSLAKVVGRLLPRWFIERDVHADRSAPLLLQPRWAMSLLRGPMTRAELALARSLVW